MDIHRYMRAVAERSPSTTTLGHFLVMFDPHDDNPYRNYAIPEAHAATTDENIATLIEAFAVHRRTPRLEYLADAAPELEGALLANGFTIEGRLPLMIISRASLRSLSVPPDIDLVFPASDDELLAVAAAQNAAFGGASAANIHDVQRLRRTLDRGGLVICARDAVTRKAVGGGLYTAPHDGTTELAMIGVVASQRRRGIAAALTSRLSAEAFTRGLCKPFLTAASEAEERIYARAGFVTVSHIVHVSLRPEGATA
jgi:GNAT superfamily N-acetyltransferase